MTLYFGLRILAPRLMNLRSLIGMFILASVAMASNKGPWKLKTQKSGFTKTQLMSGLTAGVSWIPAAYTAATKLTGYGDWSIIEVRYDHNHSTWRLADYDHKYAKVCTLRDEWFTIDKVLQHDVENKRIHVHIKGMNNRWIWYNEENAILFINHLLTRSGRKGGKPVGDLERVCREINDDKTNKNLCDKCKSACVQCSGTGRVPGKWWGTNECSVCKGTGEQSGVSSCGSDLCQNGLLPPFPSLAGRSVAVMGARHTTPCGTCSYNIPAAYKFCPECGTPAKTNLPHGWRVDTDPATKRKYYVGPSGVSQWEAPAPPTAHGPQENVAKRLATAMGPSRVSEAAPAPHGGRRRTTATRTPSEEALSRRRLVYRPKSHVSVLEALLVESNRLRQRSRD